jgi:hypothetical protein
MSPIRQWSLALDSPRTRRPRWLGVNGHLTSDPGRALRLVCPEVAARRAQAFLQLKGWPPEAVERFRLVAAPPAGTTASSGSDDDSLRAA